MLQAINDKAKGWLGIFIVGLISLPFALWGIQSYVGGSSEQYAAKVNDIEISPQEFEFNLNRQRQQLQQQFGGKLPFEDVVLKLRVMDQIVNRKLLEGSTSDLGYVISDAQLSENIKNIFTRDGKFDREYLEQVLQSQNMSASQMEYQLRNDMQISQVMDAYTETGFVTDYEAKKLAEIESQQRKIISLTFNLDHFSSDIKVTEDEIKAAYADDSDSYMLPEKVSIEYIELKAETLAKDIEVDEEVIATLYEEYVASVSQKEQRKAKHILLKTDTDAVAARAQIEDIKQQLTDGALFDDLARKYSQDAGSAKQGGDLGWVEDGQMVKPFEDALYALEKVGAVSNVVESEFGLHLIKLENIQSEPAKSLVEKRADLEKDFRREAANDKFYELSELMASTAYENTDSLSYAAEAVNVQPQSSSYFTRESGSDIANNEKVRNAAFSPMVLEENANSDVIEITPEHILVIRLLDHKPASKLALDNVRSAIENGVRLRKSHEKTMAAATAAMAKINSGEIGVNQLVTTGITLATSELLTRKDSSKMDPLILEAAFNMSAPEEGKLKATDVSTYAGDVALVIVDEIVIPENIEQTKIDAIKAQLKQDISTRELGAALLALKDKADIKINDKVLQ